MDQQQLQASMEMAAALPLHNGCPKWLELVSPWANMPLPSMVAQVKDLLNGKLIGTKCKFCEHVFGDEVVLLVALAAKKLSSVIEVVENK